MTQQNTASGVQKKPRILVADDTDVNQKIAQLILQKSGYEVEVVENGQAAVEACRQHPCDLILMDIQMPIMDGIEATQKIRDWERGKEISEAGMRNTEEDPTGSKSEIRNPKSEIERVPIIAMTGSAGPERFDETLYPGMNDCVGKPLQRDLLLAVVQKWTSPASRPHTGGHPADAPPAMDQRPASDHAPLDLERAIQEFMGRKDILMGVLQDFIISAGSRLDTIRRAAEGTDYRVIGSEAHAIKGAAANLAADKLAGLASELEQAAGRQQPDGLQERVDKLGQEVFNLEKYVQQLPDA
jgi:CheY-like chemotaxis protein